MAVGEVLRDDGTWWRWIEVSGIICRMDILVIEPVLLDLEFVSTWSISSAFNTDSDEANLSAIFMERSFVELAGRPIVPDCFVNAQEVDVLIILHRL